MHIRSFSNNSNIYEPKLKQGLDSLGVKDLIPAKALKLETGATRRQSYFQDDWSF